MLASACMTHDKDCEPNTSLRCEVGESPITPDVACRSGHCYFLPLTRTALKKTIADHISYISPVLNLLGQEHRFLDDVCDELSDFEGLSSISLLAACVTIAVRGAQPDAIVFTLRTTNA